MIVYIAGPMTGLPDLNYPAFNAAEEALTAVYDDLGITEGMRQGIARAEAEGRPVEVRQLAGWDDPEPARPTPCERPR